MQSGGWQNPAVRLYHGTLETHVASLLAGVDVTRGRPAADFGRGFYTTTVLDQAAAWAEYLVERQLPGQAHPAVVRFDVSRDALAPLETLWFVRGSRDANDFWTFIEHCRRGATAHRAGGAWYDVVVGPVTQNWTFRLMMADSDQVSFHTARAAAILNASKRLKVPGWP
jgi:hypothetical protein